MYVLNQWTFMLFVIITDSSHGYCNNYLVTGDHGVPNEKITASSFHSQSSVPWLGRIFSTTGSWVAESNDIIPYIQVEFRALTTIEGVVTRGRGNGYQHWVDEFEVEYSTDGVTWDVLLDISENQVFIGNSDSDTTLTNYFENTQQARFVRIIALGYNTRAALRFDVLGCATDTMPSGCFVDGDEYTEFLLYKVTNYQITASSFLYDSHEPWACRLNYSVDQGNSGWAPKTAGNDEYLQGVRISICDNLGFDGCHMWDRINNSLPWCDEWTGKSQPECDDGSSWTYVEDIDGNHAILPGVTESSSNNVYVSLREVLEARLIRIFPYGYEGWPATYLDVIGSSTTAVGPLADPKVTTDDCTFNSQLCYEYLVSGTYGIRNDKFTASSFHWNKNEPWESRINSSNSWRPLSATPGQYLQVDLGMASNVTCVVTKERPDYLQYLRTFTIEHSKDGIHWTGVEESAQTKDFIGNDGTGSEVLNRLPIPIQARYFRIYPGAFHNYPAVRFDLLGCRDGREIVQETTVNDCVYESELCNAYLVSGPDRISNRQITASNFYALDQRHEPWNGRINSSMSWTGSTNSASDTVQVDFGTAKIITCIATKPDEGNYLYTRSYYVYHSMDGDNWEVVLNEFQQEMLFPSQTSYNVDMIIRKLPHPVYARYVKLSPKTYRGRTSMRFDILGCSNGTATQTAAAATEYENCRNYIVSETSDYKLTTSSVGPGKGSDDAKLRSVESWAPDSSDVNPYIQVELNKPYIISNIVTLGSDNNHYHVRSYYIHYSDDGVTWTTVTENGIDLLFPGNELTTVSEEIVQPLPEAVYTQFIRLYPYSYLGKIDMRFDILGCSNDSADSSTEGTTSQTTTAVRLSSLASVATLPLPPIPTLPPAASTSASTSITDPSPATISALLSSSTAVTTFPPPPTTFSATSPTTSLSTTTPPAPTTSTPPTTTSAMITSAVTGGVSTTSPLFGSSSIPTPSTSATSLAVSTTTVPNNYSTTEMPCVCVCKILNVTLSIGSPALAAKIMKMVNEVKVSKNQTSLSISRKVCATDERSSSEVMGALGGCMLAFSIGIFVLFDFTTMITSCKR